MKTILKRIAYVLIALIATVGIFVGIEYFAGQPMGLFAGSRPANLGFNAGKFAACGWKPNCVSSTAERSDQQHYIAPFSYASSGVDAWNKLLALIKGMPRTTVVTANGNYISVEFKSAGMGFVDDIEFALDEKAGVIHVRSASRLGIRDFDVNRKRVESIRAQRGN
ncbi:MAG: DUF1499 domain-containing protein [Betaproteobacteria bacterium]